MFIREHRRAGLTTNAKVCRHAERMLGHQPPFIFQPAGNKCSQE